MSEARNYKSSSCVDRSPSPTSRSPKKEFKAALRAALWRLVARGCLTLQTTAA